MICPKCGRTFPDGTQCPCGAPVLSSNPAVNIIKTVGSSPLFLAATILYSVMILLNLFTSFGASAAMDELYYYGANAGVNPEVFYPVMDMVESSSLVGMVLSSIPSILLAVGMWMTYVTCRNTQTGNISTAGLTICKVLSYITLILTCVLVAIGLVVLVIVVVAAGSSVSMYNSGYGMGIEESTAMAGVMTLLGVVVVVAFGLLALYVAFEICVIKTINRIKGSALNGAPDNRIPRFLTGILMVFGVLGGLGGLISLFLTPVAGLASLAGSASMILVSLVLGRYRNLMTMLIFPPVQPVYPQNMPPYQSGGPNGNYPQ